MESKQQEHQENIMILRTAIKQLIDQEKERCKNVLVSDDDIDKHLIDHRLLRKLLSQVETLEIEIENGRTRAEEEPEEESSEEVVVIEPRTEKNEVEEQGRRREEEIIRELNKVKRQNFITHCLLSAMFVLTVAWQLSEVSLILKVKESINNPIRSIGGMFTGIFKKPPALVPVTVSADNKQDDDNKPKQGHNTVIQTSIPGIIVPKLPSVNLPSLDFDFDRD